MRPKFACADFTFPLLSLEQSLDLIALLGVEGVDIGLFEQRGNLWPSKELRQPTRSGAVLRRKLAACGLKLADMFLIPATDFASQAANHPEAAVRRRGRDQFLRCLDYTLAAGGKHLSSLPGVKWAGEMWLDSLRRCAEELVWRVEQARSAGLVFSIEAHVGSLIPKPAQTRKLLELTPGLTLTLDYGHFIYQGIPNEQIHPLIPHASHFHARAGARKRLQAALPQNTIDFEAILRVMQRSNYTGWLGLEYVWIDWQHCNEVDNLSETIRLRDHLRELVARVK